MVRADIVAGLRNAVERGYSLEQARQTLLNSGYNSQEVQEAVNFMQGNFPELEPLPKQSIQPLPVFPADEKMKQLEKPKKKNIWFLVLFLAILFILVIGLVLSFLYKEKIIDFLNSLFS